MSDLIERDKAIDVLDDFQSDIENCVTNAYAIARQRMITIPSAEPTWASVLAELHERFDALEKEIRKASAEMSAIIREYVDGQKDEPQTIIGERFPSYITENNAQVLDGWQANPRTSTTAVEDEPQTEREGE